MSPYDSPCLQKHQTSVLLSQVSVVPGVVEHVLLLEEVDGGLSLLEGVVGALSLLEEVVGALSLFEKVVGGLSLLEDEGGSVSVVVATVCLLNHLPTSSGSSASFING